MRRSIAILSLSSVAAFVLVAPRASTQDLGPPPPLPKIKASPTPPVRDTDQELDPEDVISVNTTEIMLPVTVRDHIGRLVPNLTRKDFRVFEDGSEQSLNDISLRQAPVDVALVVDASSSVADNLDDFRSAAEDFASYLSAEDRLCLIQFDDKVTLLQDWTRSIVQLRRALRRIAPGMFTRFHDAMLLASREQSPRPDARHAIIVLTDGIDSGRGSTFDAALRAALQSQTTVYVISNTQIERTRKQEELETLLSGSDATVKFNTLRVDDLRMGLDALDASERNLEALTASTGGRVYKPVRFTELQKTYAEVAQELRQQYTLYYSPNNPGRDGKFRRVRVETNNSSHRISARIGYYAPSR
jgi:Ca-activated chloride channel homolog